VSLGEALGSGPKLCPASFRAGRASAAGSRRREPRGSAPAVPGMIISGRWARGAHCWVDHFGSRTGELALLGTEMQALRRRLTRQRDLPPGSLVSPVYRA
jgi:hypothetical protein